MFYFDNDCVKLLLKKHIQQNTFTYKFKCNTNLLIPQFFNLSKSNKNFEQIKNKMGYVVIILQVWVGVDCQN